MKIHLASSNPDPAGATPRQPTTIRAATPADAGPICAIINGVVRDTLFTFTTVEKTRDEVSAEITAKDGLWWVAEQEGVVLGHATFGSFRSGPGYAHTAEHTVHLLATAEGQGIGRLLMERLLQDARARGIHVLVAGISGANPGAVAFHQKLGFVEVGRMPAVGHKADQWLDLVLMQKIL